MLPRVTVITTGGTIASRVDAETGAAIPVVSGAELVALVPEIGQLADIDVRELSLVPSWEFTVPYMHKIGDAVRAAFAVGANGVVITQGTDTLEETAFWLDLTLDVVALGGPAVITGAMRNNSETGADGPRNLADAVRVAAEGANGFTVPVFVANSQIHAGRFVAKTDSFNPAAFQSPGHGPIGAVYGEVVTRTGNPTALATLPVTDPSSRVPLVTWAAGMDDLFLRACLEADVDGVVIAGTGLGHIPGACVPAVAVLRERGIPVVVTTRCQSGPALAVYGGPGGGRDLIEMGCLLAAGLSGVKSRLLLIAGLGAGLDEAGLRVLFAGPRGTVTV
ncbi:MAG: asparaginase [Thermomicrobiales bacterium]